jgi:hypothetical protein
MTKGAEMFKTLLLLIGCCLTAFPAMAQQTAQGQLQNAADKGVTAVQTTSADKSKGSAADAFRDNGTNACLCKAADGTAFACSCNNPLAINGKAKDYSKGYTAEEVGKTDGSTAKDLQPTDLIDRDNTTASHIRPEEWQERNPQHKVDVQVKPSNPLDDILSGKDAPADSHNNYYESKETDSSVGQVVNYRTSDEVKLMKQAAAQKKQQRLAEEEAKKKQDNRFENAVVGAVVGAAVTHAVFAPTSHKKQSSGGSGHGGACYVNGLIDQNKSPACCKKSCSMSGYGYEYKNGSCVCLVGN